jgi:hypothetical protein
MNEPAAWAAATVPNSATSVIAAADSGLRWSLE